MRPTPRVVFVVDADPDAVNVRLEAEVVLRPTGKTAGSQCVLKYVETVIILPIRRIGPSNK